MKKLDIRNLSFTYPGRRAPALHSVDLSLAAGDFAVLLGPSGCGKTTLLRHVKPALTPHGERTGEVLFDGQPVGQLSAAEQAARIGFVMQSPEDQIVTERVWQEMAFGLENLGKPPEFIRRRIAETATFFGMQDWFGAEVRYLSGGQKQVLALASVMAMDPDILLLDEPTAQLDPLAAERFLDLLSKINGELGTTILLSEHRLEMVLPRAGVAVAMTEGRVLAQGEPRAVSRALYKQKSPLVRSLPTPTRLYFETEGAAAGGGLPAAPPLTVREGRAWLASLPEEVRQQVIAAHKSRMAPAVSSSPLATLKNVYFRYTRDGADILKDLNFEIPAGQLTCIVGANGCGKTTLLSLLTGENTPGRGKVRFADSAGGSGRRNPGVAAVPQDPRTLFAANTVEGSLKEVSTDAVAISALAEKLGLAHLTGAHPYDLSGGEQQRLALAMALLTQPRLLLLDEPTKGMDAAFKESFARILRSLTEAGTAVLLVSHDLEFCAAHADTCALLFDGSIVSAAPPEAFFAQNRYYTTAAARLFR
jgi:energy-coupling factor transport system ATP-binding protein